MFAVLHFNLIENTPVQISGRSGFKLMYTLKNRDGLKIKSIYYGFLYDEGFYAIRYSAAQRHYFDKDLQNFQNLFASFQLNRI